MAAKTKEQIFSKLQTLYNQVKSEFPEYSKHIPTIYSFVSYKVYELESMYAKLGQEYEDMILSKERNKYWETEEGKKLKKELEISFQNNHNEIISLNKFYENKIRSIVKTTIDNDWDCYPNECNFEIGLIDKSGLRTFYFGHTFSVELDAWDDNTLKINYGSFGSFDPIIDINRIKYLEGLGKFVNNTESVNQIKELMIEWKQKLKILNNKERMISKKLYNPFEN